ncbi:hypothetical protein XENOCAPTIV_022178 [Xenoophorus captivus]|uniref:Uncharacterized protein n=1 Tax=Xenoophorus captivus TaxID=1517983 RepID=A0ABV0RIJ7_9TELE
MTAVSMTHTNGGHLKGGDSAKLRRFHLLTQPLKLCTSIPHTHTQRCPLLFIHLPLSSPFTPSSSKAPLSPLFCLRASLSSDEDTLQSGGAEMRTIYFSRSPPLLLRSPSFPSCAE